MKSVLVPMDRAVKDGKHCSSSALASVLRHTYPEALGDISEAMAFGIGAGASFGIIEGPGRKPLAYGVRGTLHTAGLDALGIGYLVTRNWSDDEAESWMLAQLAQNRPVWTQVDVAALRYGRFARGWPTFQFHKIIINGYDAEKDMWCVVDRDGAFQETRENLRKAREPEFTEGTSNLAVVLTGSPLVQSRARAIRVGLGLMAATMLHGAVEPGKSGVKNTLGLEAMRVYRELMKSNSLSADDMRGQAHIFETNGTGGGNFRLLLASFFSELRNVSDLSLQKEWIQHWESLARESAALWTQIANLLSSEQSVWETVDKCINVETLLWRDVASKLNSAKL